MTTAAEHFERWWNKAYEGSLLHNKETARTFWLAAWQARGVRDKAIADNCDCVIRGSYGCRCGTIARAIAQED